MKKFKTGDTIIIIYGQCKTQTGTIKSIIKNGQYVIVEGLKTVKKNIKGNPNKGINPGIIDKESPIHISNIAIFNTETNKIDKIIFSKNGKKTCRIFKSNKKNIGYVK